VKFYSNIKNLSVVSAINFINLGLGLVFFTSVASSLTVENLGIYSLLTLILVSSSKLVDFGSNSTFVSEYLSRNQNLMNEFLNFKVISFFATSGLLYILFFWINNFQDLNIFFTLILGLFFYMWSYILFALYQKDEMFLQASLINFFPACIKGFFGALILTKIIDVNLTSALWVFSISMSGSLLMIFPKINELSTFKLNFRVGHFVKRFYQAGISQFLSDSIPTTSTQITKFLRDLSDLGTFSIASKLSNVFSTISYSIFTVILATNSKRKQSGKNYNLKESLIIGLVLLLIAFFGSTISPFVFDFLFGEKFNNSILLFNILLFSGAITATHRFLENYFYIEQQTSTLLKITILKISLLIIIGTILTSEFGLLGLVIADLIVAITISLLSYSYIKFKK